MIKKIILCLASLMPATFIFAQNGLEKIVVETYYVSDASDSAISFDNGGGLLPSGSVTYRIYADMLPGYKFQAAYGVPGHTLFMATTTSFFNNEDRGSYQPAWNKTQASNNSVMLDSYLTVGGVTTSSGAHQGVLKTDDNGVATIVNGDGMLLNNDVLAGIPLTVQDGFFSSPVTAPTFVGISSGVANELDVLDATSQAGNLFTTSNGSWASLTGSLGPDADTNRVLIAQITTDGVFTFELNIQIGTPGGGTENYVANNPIAGEIVLPSLTGTFGAGALAPVANFNANDPQFCATGSTTFTDASTNSPTSWQWTFPGGTPASSTLQNPTVTYMVKGTYDVILTATNATGSNTITKAGYIVIDSLPVSAVTPGANQIICKGDNTTLTAATNVPSASYQWQKNNVNIPGAVNSTLNVTQQAAYRVIVTNTANSCSKRSVPVTVFTQQPTAPISATGNTTFCSGGSVNLQSSGAGNTFQWMRNNIAIPGATAVNYSATSYGGYRVKVTDTRGCENTSGSIYVTVYQNPNVTVTPSGPLTFCAGQSVDLVVQPQSGVTYQWKKNGTNITGATASQLHVTTAGKYRVTASRTATGCQNTSSNQNVIVNCRIGGDGGETADQVEMTEEISLFPNPSNEHATASFMLKDAGNVTLTLSDLSGKNILKNVTGSYEAGENKIDIQTSQLTSGIYLVKFTTAEKTEFVKLVVAH